VSVWHVFQLILVVFASMVERNGGVQVASLVLANLCSNQQ